MYLGICLRSQTVETSSEDNPRRWSTRAITVAALVSFTAQIRTAFQTIIILCSDFKQAK